MKSSRQGDYVSARALLGEVLGSSRNLLVLVPKSLDITYSGADVYKITILEQTKVDSFLIEKSAC